MTGRSGSGDLEIAVEAAIAAGRVIIGHFGAGLDVRYKSAEQPVTQADLEADGILRRELMRARPEYGWISEEMTSPPPTGRGPTWVVDPLDGTANFVAGRPEFAICIGLWEEGRPVLGVIYDPVGERVYHALEGGGAFRDGEPIEARPSSPRDPILVASHGEIGSGRLDAFTRQWQVTLLGSTALKMMRVAEGQADLYLSTTPKGVWDVCAGCVIAGEAGATVRDRHGKPLDLSVLDTTIDGLVMTGPTAVDYLPDLIARFRPAEGTGGSG